jgi:hypothetical protein
MRNTPADLSRVHVYPEPQRPHLARPRLLTLLRA